jgi:hypothetical protein
MSFSRKNSILTLVVALLLASTAAFAKVPVRGSSSNGEDPDVANWNLLSVSAPINLAAKGQRLIATRQIVCLNQDVENSLANPTPALAGTCDSGAYLHIFQLQSTATNLTVTLGQLTNFLQTDTDGNDNFGVLTCDPDNGNTLELCTVDPNDPDGNNIPDITFSEQKNKKLVSFAIPNFPSYPAGINLEGQGLTIFIIIRQAQGTPIQLPKISIH